MSSFCIWVENISRFGFTWGRIGWYREERWRYSTPRIEKGKILPIGLSACFWSIRLVGALALALTDSCASGLADWRSTGASWLAKAVLVVPNRGVSTVLSYWSRVVYFGLCSDFHPQCSPIFTGAYQSCSWLSYSTLTIPNWNVLSVNLGN
jgi:hypothetical protein